MPRKVEYKGSLIMPENAQDSYKPQFYGEVISVGEKVDNIMPGDVIFFHVGGGQAMILEDFICKVLKYEEVYGIESRPVDDSRLPEDAFMKVVQNPQNSSKIIAPPHVRKAN